MMHAVKDPRGADMEPRWLCLCELQTGMGFPIKREHQEAANGVRCQFSDGAPAPSSRSRASTAHQTGNT
eukprot:1696753-Alexandrium_andersonii.AAC.1